MHSILKPRLSLSSQPAVPFKRRKLNPDESKQTPLIETPISLFSPRNNPDFKLSLSRTNSYEKMISTLDNVFVDVEFEGCDTEDLSWLKSTPSPVRGRHEAIQKYIAAIDPKKEDSPRPPNIVYDFFNFGVHSLTNT